MTKRRLLTIGHSYVVALNRRLASEMARVDDAQWDVTVAAPEFVQGDLRPIPFESANDAARVRVVGYRGASPHLMAYSGLSGLLSQDWDLVHCWEEPYGLAAAQIALMTPRGPLLVMVSAQNIAKTYPPPFSLFERQRDEIMAGARPQDYQVRAPGRCSMASRCMPLGRSGSSPWASIPTLFILIPQQARGCAQRLAGSSRVHPSSGISDDSSRKRGYAISAARSTFNATVRGAHCLSATVRCSKTSGAGRHGTTIASAS